MAKNVKGITIDIGANTSKFSSALSKLNAPINKINSELKSLNNALKLDPKNTTLLAQKQELLKKNIAESTNKLNELKRTQQQMGDYSKLTDEQKEAYRRLTTEIVKSESAIKNMNKELRDMNSIDLKKVGDALKKVGEVALDVVKKVGAVVVGVGTAIAGVVAKGVKSYAELEQNIGGVETLFGDSAQKVIDNANKAYETAGVSANEYMQGVTSFAASLLQSTAGDTDKAADIADMAFKDMSDNANKFGTSMDSIQHAYQGFAKQNYTMLDNLKLGYGGTKSEMERLLADAEKLSGVKYDISNLSDVYNAIHVIQDELDVTHTTEKEAATTISGSMNSMKAAFDNFLNGSGSPEQLANAMTTFLKNVSNVVLKLAPSIMSGLVTLIQQLLPQISSLLTTMLPMLLEAAQNLISSLLEMISQNVQPIADMVTKMFSSLVKFILQNLPLIIQTGLQIIVALANGIAKEIPNLMPVIVETIMTIIQVIIDNLPMILDAGINILIALIEGIINALPELIAKLPQIIVTIVTTLLSMKTRIITAGIQLLVALITGILRAIPQLISNIPKVISGMYNALKSGITNMLDIGKNVVKGIWSGISNSLSWIKDKIKGWVGNVTGFLKKLFKIKSPSRLMEDEIGENLGLGIAQGIENTVGDVENAMRGLSSRVEASVNPTINPTANSNPLIIQIENFNNERGTDIQTLAEELEFYRKNAALARGGS